MFNSLVCIGDSFTEGVGDDDLQYANGVRGWADRTAYTIAQMHPDFHYANLAIRGKKIDAIIAEQVSPAIALNPDLITFYAGANDLIRPKVDLDYIVNRVNDLAAALRAQTSATILTFTACDLPPGFYSTLLRGRYAFFNEYLREIAEKHALTLIDYWRMYPQYRKARYWSNDRIHMSPEGHLLMANQVLQTLGFPVMVPEKLAISSDAPRTFSGNFFTTSVLPWISHRIHGTSSGDDVQPKYPTLISPLSTMPG